MAKRASLPGRDKQGRFKRGHKLKSRLGTKKTGGRKSIPLDKFKKIAEEYFDMCEEEKKPMTVQGLAFALGIRRQTLYERYNNNPIYADVMEYCASRIEKYAVDYGFWLKSPLFLKIYLQECFNWHRDGNNNNDNDDNEKKNPVRIIGIESDVKGVLGGRNQIESKADSSLENS